MKMGRDRFPLQTIFFPFIQTLLLLCFLSVSGCASYEPKPMDEVGFQERAKTQQAENVRVTAAVLSAEETRAAFDLNLYKKGIQPIWVEIENMDDEPVWFLPFGVDPDYFAPLEVAYMHHSRHSKRAKHKMDRYFYDNGIGLYVGPGSTRSGFVFTHLDEGTKGFNVDLITKDRTARTFTFFIQVPGLRVDHREVDFETLYPEVEILSHEKAAFRKAIANLPCCTKNEKGTELGDPLNLIVIGEGQDVYHALIRAGWDETETIYRRSLWKTGVSFLFGGRYRYSPVSALHVFGRPQDAAFQQARGSIHERNHLRLWLAPMRYEGNPVWVGQISRDIGVRFTSKTITTHKIDPDVDETRAFLIQDFWYSGGLEKFGYAKGVGAASISEPRGNLTGDPYFTDGLRAVLQLSSDPIPFSDVESLNWETPPPR
jgi:hypothetical protein